MEQICSVCFISLYSKAWSDQDAHIEMKVYAYLILQGFFAKIGYTSKDP